MMKSFFLLFILLLSLTSEANDYYNKFAGFGLWYPGSWTCLPNGRSVSVSGSEFDQFKSEIFIGDNWDFKVVDLNSLKALLIKTYGNETPIYDVSFSTLKGFLIGDAVKGEYFLFRENNNYVYIRFKLEGSGYQLKQAQAVLNSIHIRNDPIEN